MAADRQLCVQMLKGPIPGRVYVLTKGTSLSIGRLPDCDIADPEDLTLSRLHAVLECQTDECWLVNRSSNGTRVNGNAVERTRLREGDRIECAQLLLAYLGTQVPEPLSAPMFDVPTRPESRADDDLRFAALRLPSGWTWLKPASTELSCAKALNFLGRIAPHTVLIVDWRRAGMSPPEGAPPGTPLFHWLPAESAALASPMVIPWESADWSAAILQEAAGKDALLWLLTEHEFDPTLAQLHRATGYGTQSGLVGYCWPSVLVELLKYQATGLIQPVLQAGVAWLLDLPETWGVAVNPSVRDELEFNGWRIENATAESEAVSK